MRLSIIVIFSFLILNKWMSSFSHAHIMASSSAKKLAPKLVMLKSQGVPMKSRFHDDYYKVRDTDLGHIDLGEFLKICNKPTERSTIVSTLIHSGLVCVASHPMSMQSSELIMTLPEHFVHEERVVKSVNGEVVLDF